MSKLNSQILSIIINVLILVPIFAYIFIVTVGGLDASVTNKYNNQIENATFSGNLGDDKKILLINSKRVDERTAAHQEIPPNKNQSVIKSALGTKCKTNNDCGSVSWLECTNPTKLASYAPNFIAANNNYLDNPNSLYCLPTREALNHDCNPKKGGTLELIMSHPSGHPRFVCQCTRPEFFTNNGNGDCGVVSACSDLGGTVVAGTDKSISTLQCKCPMAPQEYYSSDNGKSEPRCIPYTFFDAPNDPPSFEQIIPLPYDYINSVYLDYFLNKPLFENGRRHLPDPCTIDALDGSQMSANVAKSFYNPTLDVVYCRISDEYQRTHVPLTFSTDYLHNNNGRYPNGVMRLRKVVKQQQPLQQLQQQPKQQLEKESQTTKNKEPQQKAKQRRRAGVDLSNSNKKRNKRRSSSSSDTTINYGLEFNVTQPQQLVPIMIGTKTSLRKNLYELVMAQSDKLFASESREFFRFFFLPNGAWMASSVAQHLSEMDYSRVFTLNIVPEMIFTTTTTTTTTAQQPSTHLKNSIKHIGYVPVYIPVLEFEGVQTQPNHYALVNMTVVSDPVPDKPILAEVDLLGNTLKSAQVIKKISEPKKNFIDALDSLVQAEILRALNAPGPLKLAIPPILTRYERDKIFMVNHTDDAFVFAIQFSLVPLKGSRNYPANSQLLIPIYVKPVGTEIVNMQKLFEQQKKHENEAKTSTAKLVVLALKESTFTANSKTILYIDTPSSGHIFTPMNENFEPQWNNYVDNLKQFVGNELDKATTTTTTTTVANGEDAISNGAEHSVLALDWQLSVLPTTVANVSRPSLFIRPDGSENISDVSKLE